MKRILAKVAMLLALGVGLMEAGWAAEPGNAIKQVQVRRDGDKVLLKVEMRDPVKVAPGNWSVVEPPRVVFDFPDTQNASGGNVQQIAAGDLRSINLVQTEKLTRLVLNLYRPTKYSTEVEGNNFLIRLESQPVAAGVEAAPSAYQKPQQAKSAGMFDAEPATVRDIVFRRGADGQGLIIVDLSDGTVPIDVRRSGNGVTVELSRVGLPERLQNRRDVIDFATPVNFVTANAVGDMTRLEIAAKGKWFHQAQLANNQLTIEVKPIPVDDANKLVQQGQQGQKVSINFFDADSALVLRTLAEISGKNVMIDPSLLGRKITVGLDNIPYDQALEIVMTQVNAAMRIRNDVVLFGDRTVLQQRDQAAADEAARANDTAPLVSETFTLSYIKPTDLAALIRANIADSAGGSSESTPGSPAAAPAPAPAAARGGAAVQAPSGMLSARGTLATHDLTKKLFVRDTASVIEAIREVVRNVDVPQKQVMIEARIVEASTGFTSALGTRLRFFNSGVATAGNTMGSLGTANTSTANLSTVDVFGAAATPTMVRSTTQGFGTNFNLAGTTAINLMLFNSAATKLITLELQAAEADSKNKTISAPRVVTMDRKAATINNTQQVTILTGVNAQTGLPIYQTFAAPLTLTVTPAINPDNRVSLDLNIAKSTITNVATGSLDTNTIKTNVIVENGGTVVIGGFTREGDIESQDRVPFLGDLPYVGFLFKATSRNRSRSELLVFITPRIVNDTLAAR